MLNSSPDEAKNPSFSNPNEKQIYKTVLLCQYWVLEIYITSLLSLFNLYFN